MSFWEAATCLYNGCADGGLPVRGARQVRPPSLALGLPACAPLAAAVRAQGQAVVHTATWEHRARVARLLATGAAARVVVPPAELAPAPGVATCRIAAAPVALACALREELPLGDGQSAFFLDVVGVHVRRGLIDATGAVDSLALRAVAAWEPSGLEGLVAVREEYTMPFPQERDVEGRWLVPKCTRAAPPAAGDCSQGDLEYLPPELPDLPFNPFKALIVPRPIAWVSTRGEAGDNLSPYSFFGYLAPDVVFFGAGGAHVEGGEKDALRDARSSGVFCVNAVPWELRLAMSASSAEVPRGDDEFVLPVAPGCFEGAPRAVKGACAHIDAPCVANAPLRLECRVLALVKFAEALDVAVVGRVLHGAGDGLEGGALAVAARGGYYNYFRIATEHSFDPLDMAATW